MGRVSDAILKAKSKKRKSVTKKLKGSTNKLTKTTYRKKS